MLYGKKQIDLVSVAEDFFVTSTFGDNGQFTTGLINARQTGIGTTTQTVWGGAGESLIYPFLLAPTAVRIRAGGNAADDVAGSGARVVALDVLDSNWDRQFILLSTAGAAASADSAITINRINGATCILTGTYGGRNVGTINIETTGGTLLDVINPDIGFSQQAVFTVPRGFSMKFQNSKLNHDASKTVMSEFMVRGGADIVTAPFAGTFEFFKVDDSSGDVERVFDASVALGEKTDVWVNANVATGTVNVTFIASYVLKKLAL